MNVRERDAKRKRANERCIFVCVACKLLCAVLCRVGWLGGWLGGLLGRSLGWPCDLLMTSTTASLPLAVLMCLLLWHKIMFYFI